MKLTNAPKKAPHPNTTGPNLTVAVCQFPLGIKNVTIGIITLSTSDLIKLEEARPIIKAIASPTILYSFKNSLNSLAN